MNFGAKQHALHRRQPLANENVGVCLEDIMDGNIYIDIS